MPTPKPGTGFEIGGHRWIVLDCKGMDGRYEFGGFLVNVTTGEVRHYSHILPRDQWDLWGWDG